MSPSHLKHQERAKWAYSLRQQGKTFRQIAEWFSRPGTSYARELVERGRRIRETEAAALPSRRSNAASAPRLRKAFLILIAGLALSALSGCDWNSLGIGDFPPKQPGNPTR